jgi:ligand-binding sensor domain-containing protein/signal transduction histidine kinase
MNFNLNQHINLKRLSVFLITFYVFAVCQNFAQSPTYYLNNEKKLTQYNSESWTTENGLPTNSLLSICQTSDGYLWIASYDGLVRFDGHEFKVFNKKNTDEFTSNTIRKLAEGKNGYLWMATQGNGLVSYKNGVFKSYGEKLGLKHLYRAIYIDDENRLWSASPDKGWFYFKEGQFSFLKHSSSLRNIEVRSIERKNDGSMWFGTFGKGLYCYKDGKFTQYTHKDGLLNDWVYSLFYDSKGILWVGTSNGLCYFDGKEFVTFKGVDDNTINDILEDKYGNLWFASNNGLYRKKLGTTIVEKLSSKNGLPHDFINDFLIDLEGNIWMANYKGGLAQLKDGKFTNYTSVAGLHGKVVNAICELEKGKFLVAFDNGRLSIVENGDVFLFRLKTNLSGERIRHILKDSKGNLWFSTYSGLLKVFPNGREEWLNEKTGFPQTKIRLSFEDSQGNIWVGTRNSGVIEINTNGKYTFFNVSNGLSANLIMSIDEDNDGNILVGTSEGESGLNVIANGKIIKKYSKSGGFISDIVFNCYTDKAGVIWVAANGGLCCIKGDKVTNFTVKEGLESDSPFDVVEDDLGNLWLPSSKGIMRIEKQQLLDIADGMKATFKCVLYDKHDGMVESECNPTTQSIKSVNGLLLFPTINGIAQINPSKILINNYIPPVIIEELIIDNQQADIYSDLVIDPSSIRFTFNYTAISLYEPKKVQFKYWLEGFEDNWVEAANNRSISYTNLKPGDYTFHVIASNNDGLWNMSGDDISFSIQPRFRDTIWFYLLVLTIFGGVGYSFYIVRVRQMKAKQEELERIIDKRTKEVTAQNGILLAQKAEIQTQTEYLQEQKQELNLLNASKDKMFSIIAHDLRSPLGNFKTMLDMMINQHSEYDQIEQQEMLKLLFQNAKSTYELLENLLDWSSSQRGVITYEPKDLNVKLILEEILGFTNPMAINKQIMIFSNIDESLQVYADENMVGTVFRNLIGNAIKFTRIGGEIYINAKRQPNIIEFSIKDNGIGIKSKIREKLFDHLENTIRLGTNEEKGSGLGLLLCKEFIEKNGGKIWVESQEGYGSIFYFTLRTHNE